MIPQAAAAEVSDELFASLSWEKESARFKQLPRRRMKFFINLIKWRRVTFLRYMNCHAFHHIFHYAPHYKSKKMNKQFR